MSEASIVNPGRIGFRPGCTRNGHVDLASCVKLAHRYSQVAALVTVDISNPYGSAGDPVLLSGLQGLSFPRYTVTWLYEFPSNRQLGS